MTWAATVVSVVAGVGSAVYSNQQQKKMSSKQAALARRQVRELRDRAIKAGQATEREIESLRTLRSLDLPAFRQASQQALIQAQKGAERMQRQRMMGRLAPDVRSAIFGGEFRQYVGRDMQRLGQYAGLTQQILEATERQQARVLDVEKQAASMGMQGEMAALQTEAAAGSLEANILGAVGQAASQFASAKMAKAAASDKSRAALKAQFALQAADKKGTKMPFITDGQVDTDAFNKWYDATFPKQDSSWF